MTKDNEHPFFHPLWRRIALVAFCLVWAGIEFAMDSPTWGMIMLGFSAYAAWQYLFSYAPPPVDADKKD